MTFDPKTRKTAVHANRHGALQRTEVRTRMGSASSPAKAAEHKPVGGLRISITRRTAVERRSRQFRGKKFNSPNDLALHGQGPRLLLFSGTRANTLGYEENARKLRHEIRLPREIPMLRF